ncbi:glycosyltransferase [Flavobacteriaceae bacterium 3519-10]|nr:glycosyltransferase [Flavobacteriaceae bacterium 3519-10]
MKILYLTDQLYLHGGIEKVLSQKANYFADVSGDEVTLVTYQQKDRKPVYRPSEEIRLLDLNINYETAKSYFHPVNLQKVPAHIAALKRVFRDLKPDVIVSSSFGPDFYFLPYINGNIPVIKEFHSSRALHSRPRSVKERILSALARNAEKKYTGLVVLNPDEAQYYHSGAVSVIPNPAEITDDRGPLIHKKILAAGRISPVKNFGDLIQAFAQLSADFPDWQLHFWGEDYIGTQAKLQSQIDCLALADRICFMGVTDNLKARMQKYSIYAMTSETECFPMVLLESLSAGLPVVSYDSLTGPRHIIKDGEDGFIAPHKNLDIFTEKLRLLMRDENLRQQMGSKGRINVQRFSIDKVMQQWKDLFNSVT